MAYSNYSLEQIEEKFGVKNQIMSIFPDIKPLIKSDWLEQTLAIASTVPTRTEKAKSELFVMPLLLELRKRNDNFFTIYSGENLVADKKVGLTGECDFIISKEIKSFSMNYPILQVVEAKKHDIELGLGQCAAQLLGAKIFNEKRKVILPVIYGCVTNKSEWQFLKLQDDIIYVHDYVFPYGEIDKILGVFQYIIDYYKDILKSNSI